MALNNVPLTGQTLNDTRNPINQNFSFINSAFLVDHVEYNIAGQGKHNKVTFPQQGAAPTFLANEIGLFCQNFATTAQSELYLARGASPAFPATGAVMTSFTNGWTYLPSGLLVTWGRNALVAGTKTIQYNNAGSGGLASFPSFSAFSIPLITHYNSAGGVATGANLQVDGYGTNQVTVKGSIANAEFIWFAIGR